MSATTPTAEPVTAGIHHLGLSVPDVAETAEFFIHHLGFRQVGEKPDYPAVFVSDGTVMLTLWQLNPADTAVAFDRRRNAGLHHLALRVGGESRLSELYDRLSALPAVDIEFTPEPLDGTPATHMMCRIPGGLRVEFIHAP